MKRLPFLLVLTACWLPQLWAEPATESGDAWAATAQYRFAEAQALFEAASKGRADDRSLRLGEAVAALNRPPRSAVSIEQAVHALQTLVTENRTDEVALVARYLLARIAGIHGAGAAPAEQVDALRALLEDAPQHPLAQHGAVKLCLVLLYDPALGPDPDFAAAEALLQRLTLVGPRRDAHLALGRAYLYYRREPSRAYAHLRAAVELGLQSVTTAAAVGLSVAGLAAELGETAVAQQHYRAFLRENPRDVRAQLVRERLAALEEARQP